MKDLLRQIAVILTTLFMLIINGLANALPLNGQNTGEISDRFDVYFVPAGYVFSIWGVIYLGMIAFSIYQALPAQRENPRLRAVGWWVALGSLANSAWIFLWHYNQFLLTLPVMFALLGTLLVTYLRLGTGRTGASTAETWAVRVPFSIYLGWITVATIANATDVLDYINWDGFGIAPETWMSIMLFVVLVIATAMSFTRRDAAYGLVLLWSLAGIGIKHAAVPAVAYPTWAVFGLVALGLAGAIVRHRRSLAAA